MRGFSRALIVLAVVALTGGAGLAATSTPADAHSVGVRVGVNTGYHASYYDRSYYRYRPYHRYYYYDRPHYRRHYWHRKRDFLNCRWVPGEGRVCW